MKGIKKFEDFMESVVVNNTLASGITFLCDLDDNKVLGHKDNEKGEKYIIKVEDINQTIDKKPWYKRIFK